MKLFFKRIFERIGGKKAISSALEQPSLLNVTYDVAGDFKMHVYGLPADLTPEQRLKISQRLFKEGFLALSRDRYKQGETIYEDSASLNLKDKHHSLKYIIEAGRAIEALFAIKDGFELVTAGLEQGIYDSSLSEMTIDYFKELAWKEIELDKTNLGFGKNKKSKVKLT